MKHAGSVRFVGLWNPRWMLKICLLVCLFYVTRSFTPPRIIYGGWTPILPGHPFYFGPARRRNVDYQNNARFQEHKSPIYEQFHEHPVHNAEQHFEDHIEFVDPHQLNQYSDQHGIYPHPPAHHSHNKHISGHNLVKNTYSHYPPQSDYNEPPVKVQQISGHDLNKNIYPEYPPQSAYDNSPVRGQKSNKDIYAYHSPQPTYNGPNQRPNKEQHTPTGHLLEKDIYTHIPPQSYGKPHISKGQPSLSGHKSNKNIFAYYPPQSAYDGPKPIELDYKPVYIETPRKPLDILENPRQHIPYILPTLKDLPINTLSLHDLNSLHNGDENTYLKITPIDNVDTDVLNHIGKINFDQIQYLTPDSLKHKKYPVIKDSPGGTPRHPRLTQPLSHGNQNLPSSKFNYDISVIPDISEVPYDIHKPNTYKSTSNYKGADFPLERRPLNPIETKKYRSSQLQGLKSSKLPVPKLNNYNDITILSDITNAPIYPASPNVYSNIKYPSPTKTLGNSFGISKNILSPTAISKNLANQMTKYLGPKFSSYSALKPFYPKPILPGPIFPYQSLPKNPTLIHLPLRTMPQPVISKPLPNYLPKNIKLQTLYKNPSIVTNIRGSPALIEREVAIIHVPVRPPQQGYESSNDYQNDKDYLYYTASTPESIQIPDFEKLNGSVPYVTLNKHPLFGHNDSYNHISFDYGGDKDSDHVTFINPGPRGTPKEIDNNINNPPYHNEYQYIFVSSNGVHSENNGDHHKHAHLSNQDETKKQFFHAYYAPADHVAPPGYVKMTVQEFNNLFKNAEIRYVDKDPVPKTQDDSYKKAR